MDALFNKFLTKVSIINLDFVRRIEQQIDWSNRLIGIKGARGVGKTTLLFQHIKKNLPLDKQTLYLSLDDIFFTANGLYETVERFEKNGGRYLFLDEVHHYKTWQIELKNIYDDFPALSVVFTGSSALQIFSSKADLSRRVVSYVMHGLSFREFIEMKSGIKLPVVSLQDILKNHTRISMEVRKKIKPIAYFNEYLQYGYYPFFKENIPAYFQKLEQTINHVIEVDLPYCIDLSFSSIDKIKKLLWVIASSVPFKPNISKLSQKVGVTRNTIMQYLYYLEQAGLIDLLHASTQGISYMQKAEKIYIHHPNLMFALDHENANEGNIRESFFYNQLSAVAKVLYTEKGDFLINEKYIFEVGGKNKGNKQIANIKNGFIAADNIEIGYENKIPLWLFGFLY